MGASSRLRPGAADIIPAALLALVLGPPSILLAVLADSWSGSLGGGLGGLLLAAAMTAAVLLARRRPVVALGVAWAGVALQLSLGLPPLPVNLAVLAPLFWTGASADRRARIAGLASAIVGAAVMTAYLTAPALAESAGGALVPSLVLLVAGLVSFVLAWTLGLLWATSLQARREREEALVEAERGRIAREMHDVVAHSLAVIVAQADGARYASAEDPERAREGLAAVSAIARESLGDVRALLAGLRHRQTDAPQPGIADLASVAAAVREAGLQVLLDTGDPPPGVPVGTQLAVHRIVQECLTNALRHGRRDRPVTVRLRWAADEVLVRVESAVDPSRPPSGAAGHGITGMRERARAAGGDLAVAAGESFVVEARLPIAPGAATREVAEAGR